MYNVTKQTAQTPHMIPLDSPLPHLQKITLKTSQNIPLKAPVNDVTKSDKQAPNKVTTSTQVHDKEECSMRIKVVYPICEELTRRNFLTKQNNFCHLHKWKQVYFCCMIMTQITSWQFLSLPALISNSSRLTKFAYKDSINAVSHQFSIYLTMKLQTSWNNS